MICPRCAHGQAMVTDSRAVPGGSVRRRRTCTCGYRFTTFERPKRTLGDLDRVVEGGGSSLPRYALGQAVEKPSGYAFDGWIVSVFHTLARRLRYVVDNGDGLLHIFNEAQLAPRRSRPNGGEAAVIKEASDREEREARPTEVGDASGRESGRASLPGRSPSLRTAPGAEEVGCEGGRSPPHVTAAS